jgi:hypothetical protein
MSCKENNENEGKLVTLRLARSLNIGVFQSSQSIQVVKVYSTNPNPNSVNTKAFTEQGVMFSNILLFTMFPSILPLDCNIFLS